MSATASLPQAHPHGVAFTATDIASAVSQIRATLGPDAVLLNIRRVAARGLSKLWLKPQIEVVACLPDHHSPSPEPPGEGTGPTTTCRPDPPTRRDGFMGAGQVRQEQDASHEPPGEGTGPTTTCRPGPPTRRGGFMAPEQFRRAEATTDSLYGTGLSPAHSDDLCAAGLSPAHSDDLCGAGVSPAPPDFALPNRPSHPRTTPHNAIQRYARANASPLPTDLPVADFAPPTDPAAPLDPDSSNPWRIASVLHRLGLTPLHAQRVLETIQRLHGPDQPPPPSLAHELTLARSAFRQLWRPTPAANPADPPPVHVFVGPPGSGKSTVLCKWLAQTVLVEGQSARAWRLDARAPNTAELVSLYGEILHVPVERSWNGRGAPPLTSFVDVPGTDCHDPGALAHLAKLLATLPNPSVHLVLNAAYTVPLLLAQARAFASFPGLDLILTHLDEEPAWGKLWNLVLGTNCPLRFLSAGQNIPGRFLPARPDLLSPALFEPS